MAGYAVTLQLPAPLYDLFRSRAERKQRSVEAELLEVVTTVASEEDGLAEGLARAVADLELLDDEGLWRVARNRLSESVKARLEALNYKQQDVGLTPTEKEDLEQLVHQYDRTVLLRAQAARLLKERGHDVSELLSSR